MGASVVHLVHQMAYTCASVGLEMWEATWAACPHHTCMCAGEEESPNLCAQVGDQCWDRFASQSCQDFGKVQVEGWNRRERSVRIQQEVEISQGGCAGHSCGWSELGISRRVGGAGEMAQRLECRIYMWEVYGPIAGTIWFLIPLRVATKKN